jgi:hypothetical protein
LLPENWKLLLSQYLDPTFVQNIVGIATFGTRVGYQGPQRQIKSENHASALRIPAELDKNIAEELAAGRIVRISLGDLPAAYICSPLGAVQKKANGVQTGWRRIHDLSFPAGSSVNDGIPKHFGSLSYETLHDAIALIAKYGRFVILRKRDLKDAFRKIPASPYDYWLLLFEWKGRIYVDLCLPFGMSTSPFIFNLFGEGLHWILEHIFNQSLVHYLDNFLFVGGESEKLFSEVCTFLGFEEKKSKAMDGYVLDFTGIELDSDKMEVRLPQDKHNRAMSVVQNRLHRGSTSSKELKSVLGFLSFCARVVPLGRPFLRNLFNLLQSLSHIHANAVRRIPLKARTDLRWWITLLRNWSGKRLIRQSRQIIHVYTDASGTKGIGGWWSSHAFSSRMPRRHRSKHINWKEAYAILFALAKWGHPWEGCQITFMCDNSSVVNAINKTSIRGDTIDPLQLISLAAALYDIEITSCWLSSEDNWTADSLSRFTLYRLANFQLHKLFALPSRETGKAMSELRRKLHDFFGTDLPHLQDPITTPLGETTKDSHDLITTSHSQPASKIQSHSETTFSRQGLHSHGNAVTR